MMDFNKLIIEEKVKREQLKRQQKEREQREKVALRKINTRRNLLIGEFVSEIFPEVKHFQPQRTKDASKIEFAPLLRFLTKLVADTEYVTKLKSISRDCESDYKNFLYSNKSKM